MVELVDHGAVAALRREGADMAFDQHSVVPGASAPVGRLPPIATMIDQFARAVDIFRLEVGGRIRHIDFVIDAEFIAGARSGALDLGKEPAVITALHRLRLVEMQLDVPSAWCPQAKRCAVFGRSRAELPGVHSAPAKARTEWGGALVSAPDAKSAAVCLASVVLRTSRQLLYSVIFGSLNAISSGAALRTIKIGGCPCSSGPS